MSTQINAASQLGTYGVDAVLGEGGEPRRPKGRSIEARRPSAKRVTARVFLNISALVVFVCSVFPVYWMVNIMASPGIIWTTSTATMNHLRPLNENRASAMDARKANSSVTISTPMTTRVDASSACGKSV